MEKIKNKNGKNKKFALWTKQNWLCLQSQKTTLDQ